MANFDLGKMQIGSASGLDAMLSREGRLVTLNATAGRRKVASIGDLKSFIRLSAETLVHKSERDLWALKKEADGQYFVERLFDDNGEAIRG